MKWKNGRNHQARQFMRRLEDGIAQKHADWITRWLMALNVIEIKTENDKMTEMRNFMVPREWKGAVKF